MLPSTEVRIQTEFVSFHGENTASATVFGDLVSENNSQTSVFTVRCNLAAALDDVQPFELGDTVLLSALVKETHGEEARSFIVQFFDGNPEDGGAVQIGDDVVVPRLEALGETHVTAEWQATIGVLSIYVLVDTLDQEDETDENDNAAHVTLMVLPNLVISSLAAEATGRDGGGAHEVAVEAEITNQGIAPAVESNLALYSACSGDELKLVGEQPVGPLAIGQTQKVVFKIDQTAGLSHYLATVDSNGIVEETAEYDNDAESELSIPGEANLALSDSDLSLSSPEPIEGQIITINGQIRNQGDWPAYNVVATAQVGTHVYARMIPYIPPGGSRTFSVPWFTSSFSGLQTIDVVVQDVRSDGKATNNRAQLIATVSDPAITPPKVVEIAFDKGRFDSYGFKTISVEFSESVVVHPL